MSKRTDTDVLISELISALKATDKPSLKLKIAKELQPYLLRRSARGRKKLQTIVTERVSKKALGV